MIELPQDIAAKLPSGLDPEKITACVTVHAGMQGGSGQTHLLVHDGQMVALSRLSSIFDFTVHHLDQDALPRLASRFGSQRLYVRTRDGIEHWLTLTDVDRKEALPSLDALYEACQAWDAQAATIEAEIELATLSALKNELRIRLATLVATRLGDVERAMALYKDVLLYEPDNAQAIDALMESFRATEHGKETLWTVLEPSLRAAKNWELMFEAIELLAQQSDDPSEQRRFRALMIDVCEHDMGDLTTALLCAAGIMLQDPQEPSWRQRTMALAQRANDWESFLTALHAAADACEDPASAADAWALMAQVHEEHRADPDAAIKAWLQALECVPQWAVALEGLERLYILTSHWKPLAEIYQRHMDAEQDALERAAIAMRLGALWEDRLRSAKEAIKAFEVALEAVPSHPEALKSLERLLLQVGDHQRLHEVLLQHVTHCDDSVQVLEMRWRLYNLADAMLSDTKAAVGHLRAILKLEPASLRAWEKLAQAQDTQKQWLDLAESLEAMIGLKDDPPWQADVARRLGALWQDQLHNDERARPWWERATSINPDDAEAWTALAALATRARDLSWQRQCLERLVALEPDKKSPSFVSHQAQLAQVLEQLDQGDAAEQAWRAVLKVEPDHAEAQAGLERRFEAQERWGELAQILKSRVETSKDVSTKARLWQRQAELHERPPGNAHLAIEAYQKLTALRPQPLQTRARLMELLESEQRWQELYDALQSELSHTDDEARLHDLSERAAKIAEEHLSDPEKALDALLKELDGHWGDRALCQRAGALAASAGLWRVLVERRLDRRRDRTEMLNEDLMALISPSIEGSRSAQAPEVFFAIAQGLERRGQREEAAHWFEKVLTVAERHSRARQELEKVLRRLNRWEDLAKSLETRIAQPDLANIERAQLVEELVEIYGQHLGQPAKAQRLRQELGKADSQSLQFLMGVLAMLVFLAAVVWFLARQG